MSLILQQCIHVFISDGNLQFQVSQVWWFIKYHVTWFVFDSDKIVMDSVLIRL